MVASIPPIPLGGSGQPQRAGIPVGALSGENFILPAPWHGAGFKMGNQALGDFLIDVSFHAIGALSYGKPP